MKNIAFLVLGLAMACNSTQTASESTGTTSLDQTPDPTPYAETITESELKDHLYIYASDEFEGRETGEPGQKKAVEYLKAEYEQMDIPAAKGNGNYFQKVPLELAQLPTGSVTVNGEEFYLGAHLLTFAKAQGTYNNVVYAGYGIEEDDYSDYKGLDVKGKAILIKGGEPKNEDGSYIISGSDEKSIWSNMSESIAKRMELASDKGASAVFYYDEQNFGRFKNRFDYMKNNGSGRMQLADDNDTEFANFFVDATLAKAMLPEIEANDTPETLPVKLSLDIQSENEEVDSENVVAIIKGTEKPDEYLVISSHLDHIGITADGQINNGADDDGSGTVAMLEIAEAFKKAADAGQGPNRAIVFLHVTGEEKGLLGSRYYTDIDPIFPLENTVANLNIDMIGRIDPKYEGDRNYLYLIGSDKLSTDLHDLSEAVNDKYTHIELDYTYNDENDPNRFYYRSDHYNFAKNDIPIIFYFNGTHADYHKPSDTVEKINYDLLENRTRLIFYTAWEIANRTQTLVVDKAF
ncbi:M28 family peptidase [Pricia sp. S334]|uniref:M28 family peptidase n=1 Tax=Pricia mediterranea TaxID=3076079 RepID=A0ABU3L9Q8_9FLAO|nr:M28 family peptidase [Pricia sp. S334]MDT7830128.1 M28 family peptidase [Pricia sp. S334]